MDNLKFYKQKHKTIVILIFFLDEGGSEAIQTLGYICEGIDPDYLEAYNNQILTLLVTTIR